MARAEAELLRRNPAEKLESPIISDTPQSHGAHQDRAIDLHIRSLGYNLCVESPEPSSVDLTRMLQAWHEGDQSALERLTPVVYAELHRLAKRNLAGEREGHILQPSALVNEAFLRLIGGSPVKWTSRTHFFAISARLMRQVLIDFARAQDTGKRGNRSPHIALSDVKELLADRGSPVDLIDLDTALNELAQLDARQAQVVELRYFGDLENGEIAAALGVSEPTVVRDWRMARAWLYDRLQPPQVSPDPPARSLQ